MDTRLGRKGTLALSTFLNALGLYLSTVFITDSGQLAMNCLVSFVQNIQWGVIYAYSPEVFPTSCRGTGVGIAASLSKVLGSIAPIVAGALLAVGIDLPLYVASGTICLAGLCALLLPIETRGQAAH